MDESIKKYFEDMLQAISEIEMAESRFGRQYDISKMMWFSGNLPNGISKF